MLMRRWERGRGKSEEDSLLRAADFLSPPLVSMLLPFFISSNERSLLTRFLSRRLGDSVITQLKDQDFTVMATKKLNSGGKMGHHD